MKSTYKRCIISINNSSFFIIQFILYTCISFSLKYYRFNCPVMALTVDNERNCAVIILENKTAYLANHGAVNQIHYPSGHQISVMYGVH